MGKPLKTALIVGGSVVVLGLVLFFIIFGATGGFSSSSSKSSNRQEPVDGNPMLPTQQFGVWAWSPWPYFTTTKPIQLDVDNPKNTHFNLLNANPGITDVYLQVDLDLSIEHLNLLVKEFSKRKIAVHALDGATEMFEPEDPQFSNLVKYMKSYQDAYPNEPFRGIHLDIESWGGDGNFNNPQGKRIEAWQTFMLKARDDAHKLGLVFGIDVSAAFSRWEYDNSHGKAMLSEWVSRHMDFIAVMAYRDLVDGVNGVLAISSAQLEDSSKPVKNGSNKNSVHQGSRYQRSNGYAGVLVGIETVYTDEFWGSPNGPRPISFHGQSRSTVLKALEDIKKAFNDKAGFGGVVVHDTDGFIALKD